MNSVIKMSPSKSPKKPFVPKSQLQEPSQPQQQPLRYSHQARPSPGTLKKQHPYTFNPLGSIGQQPESSMVSFDEVEFLKSRCRELEMQLTQSKSLDQSIEMERVNRLLAQKRNEAELWKQKYENQLSQLMQVKANYELEVQQLSSEVQRLLSKLDEFQYEKQRLAEDVKIQLEQSQINHLENLKKSHFQQSEMMDMQIRKMREAIEDRELEIDELRQKLERNKYEDDNEISRLLRDNEQLRSRINGIEVERQKELEQLRFKLEGYSQSTLENLKKTHSNQIEVLESEIEKLRGLLEIKNAEIETLIQQNIKIKQSYEMQISEARLEIEGLKQKLLDNEHLHRTLLEEMQQSIIDENQNEINQIKSNYESTIETLQDEIHQLNNLLQNKSEDLDHCVNERAQQREYLENQLHSLAMELDEQKERSYQIEREKNLQLEQFEQEIQRSGADYANSKDQFKQQIQFLESEIQRFKDLANNKNKDLEQQIQQFNLIKKQIEEETRNLKYENEQLKQRVYDSERSKGLEIEDLKQRNNSLDQFYREKCRQYEIKIEQLLNEAKRTRESLDIKQSELDNSLQYRQNSEKELKRIKEENEFLKEKIISIERDKLREFEDLRMKLEQSSAYQIENLKAAFNTQLNILSSENSDLKMVIDNKSHDIQELLENLDRALNSGQYGPEAYANKNIYDVYLRTKNRMSSLSKKQ